MNIAPGHRAPLNPIISTKEKEEREGRAEESQDTPGSATYCFKTIQAGTLIPVRGKQSVSSRLISVESSKPELRGETLSQTSTKLYMEVFGIVGTKYSAFGKWF